ncbi:MAG: protoporphyrinogen oxidase HemJ [Myxococcales bacterium]|nr:protoporphyrinogen oxidase HemJ [Myxococcales bacterium]MCB9750465.1 protoporphyrinogen oxidase HemJ [Myxococcales bacterium]
MLYNWLRAFHIIGVVAWFAGLFYIFRLYVYHVENKHKPEVVEVLTTMERKLYRIILTPAMVFTTVMGALLVARMPEFYFAQGWFHAKLLGLVGLFVYHFYSGKVGRDFARGKVELSSRQCRMINEAPTVLLLLIVIMVVVKPWSGT